MLCGDFFGWESGAWQADAVVGNPPFIRYQRFSGEQRRLALGRASSQGVELSALCSSWAPFVVHAASMLRKGGRLAMVLPFEVSHARYARPVLQYLTAAFGEVTFLTFRERMFRGLSEETLLVLADQKGGGSTKLLWRELADVGELPALSDRERPPRIPGVSSLDHEALCTGAERLVAYVLPPGVRDLYEQLRELPEVRPLGQVADAGVGYVSGANDYFHLSPFEAQLWQIPSQFLRRALRRGRALKGMRFTTNDWHAALPWEGAGYLLYVEPHANLPEGLIRYLQEGERLGIPEAYKCRTRNPWYSVPHVRVPDAFLSYMSGSVPKLVANWTRAVASNNLHRVHLRSDSGLTREALAALWQTSLTWLSAEIEGHALGGGMLKLEPREARSVLLPIAVSGNRQALADELDEVWRKHGPQEARKLADERILKDELGLSPRACRLLRSGAEVLMARRCHRGRNAGHAH
ncbi:MAG: SAM-dependent DNA methyltransferase [Candidatus Brocadiae bacterium]|nr:SAM-dependent DNA methyltransferase [Candidatus Brocadiia bacterium]